MNCKAIVLISIAVCLLNGCATIFNWDDEGVIRLDSSIDDTKVSIYNRGVLIDQVKTPCDYEVEADAGFFRKASYNFIFEKEGYYKQSHQRVGRFSGWYWGNIVFGGAIGMLIVDPLTGSEYCIDTKPINACLQKKPNKESK